MRMADEDEPPIMSRALEPTRATGPAEPTNPRATRARAHSALNLPLGLLSPAGPRGRLLIFTYHRVVSSRDSLQPDDVDASGFAAQMDWMREFCKVLPLAEAAHRLADGTLPARAACITFDDGYANNFEVARPILAERGLPATVFVAVDAVERGIMWNDLVIESIRESAGHLESSLLSQLGVDPGTTPRPVRVDTLLEALKYRPFAERWQLAAQLYKDVCGREPPRLMMTPDMVRALARAGFEIGAHTVNHPILCTQTPEQARFEVQRSWDWIVGTIGAQPTSFAYPNGRPGRDYDESHVRMVREAGFTLAVSTSWGCARMDSDLFQLPRVSFWDHGRGRFWARLIKTYTQSYLN